MTAADGFRLVERAHPGPQVSPSQVVFYATIVVVSRARVSAARADWLIHDNGMIRLRFGDDGAYAASHFSASRSRVYAAPLYRALGRTLRGRYPIVRAEGNEIDIDISREREA